MKICLVFTISGILLLFLLVYFIEPEKLSVGQITEKSIGKPVITNGNVKSVFVSNGHLFIKLEGDKSAIDIIMFENDAKKFPEVYDIKQGFFIETHGKVALYRGELEIIAEKINILNNGVN